MILDVLKDIKKHGINASMSPESPRGNTKNCMEHYKPIEFRCNTCDGEPICSHCAIFGRHKNHSFIDVSMSPRKPTTNDIEELNSKFATLTATIEDQIVPESPHNFLHISKLNLQSNLQKIVRLHFRQYYDQI